MLLFHHNTNKASLFTSKEEGMKVFDYNKGKYSIIYSLNSLYKIKGKYEFLLEYPELHKSNQWRQTHNPLHEQPAGKEATGYDPINITMNNNLWGGLFRHGSPNVALLVGSYTSWWYFAIGAISDTYKPCFPGPDTSRKIVYLWVKMPTDLRRLTCIRRRSTIQNSMLMINILVFS